MMGDKIRHQTVKRFYKWIQKYNRLYMRMADKNVSDTFFCLYRALYFYCRLCMSYMDTSD